MFRFRQQYWFCLAAVCLVGSLLALWSTDIRVAEDVSGTLQARHPDVVLRRPAALPTLSGFVDEQHPAFRNLAASSTGPVSSTRPDADVFIQAPAGVAGRMASPLNTTSRTLPRDLIATAGYQTIHPTSPESTRPVWLTGQIETLEMTR